MTPVVPFVCDPDNSDSPSRPLAAAQLTPVPRRPRTDQEIRDRLLGLMSDDEEEEDSDAARQSTRNAGLLPEKAEKSRIESKLSEGDDEVSLSIPSWSSDGEEASHGEDSNLASETSAAAEDFPVVRPGSAMDDALKATGRTKFSSGCEDVLDALALACGSLNGAALKKKLETYKVRLEKDDKTPSQEPHHTLQYEQPLFELFAGFVRPLVFMDSRWPEMGLVVKPDFISEFRPLTSLAAEIRALEEAGQPVTVLVRSRGEFHLAQAPSTFTPDDFDELTVGQQLYLQSHFGGAANGTEPKRWREADEMLEVELVHGAAPAARQQPHLGAEVIGRSAAAAAKEDEKKKVVLPSPTEKEIQREEEERNPKPFDPTTASKLQISQEKHRQKRLAMRTAKARQAEPDRALDGA